MADEMRNKCYDCQFRGEIPGNAHTRCLHPSVGRDDLVNDPLFKLAGLLAGGGGPPVAVEGLSVKGDPQGIEGGWFMWPVNFDPVWLLECDGFTALTDARPTPVGVEPSPASDSNPKGASSHDPARESPPLPTPARGGPVRTPEQAAEDSAFQLGEVCGLAWALHWARELKTLSGLRRRFERKLIAYRAKLDPYDEDYSRGVENPPKEAP